MCASRGQPASDRSTPKALAFYLPQYHPIPENDEWWGKGFTEWRNVTKARPLFPGPYQPHLPGELGFYDLRVPEVRIAQAELARTHGVSGFIYYHYWFHGRRLLERPFDEMLASGEPDFPFALCWANEEWTRGWDAQTGHILVRQEYSAADDLDHIHWLLKVFADPRYIRIDGRPLLLIYRPSMLPDGLRTTDLWRKEAQKAGFPDLYLCWVESWGPPPDPGGPESVGLDASVGFMPQHGHPVHTPLSTLRGHRILDYPTAARAEVELQHRRWKRFPSVMVSWDNTARRARAATIYDGATPANYEAWLRATVEKVADVRDEENYLFILAWNEWAEGNHLEPDQRYGRAFLESTRAVLLNSPSPSPAPEGPGASVGDLSRAGGTDEKTGRLRGEVVASAVSLLDELELDPTLPLIEFGFDPNMGVENVLRSRGLDVIRHQLCDPHSTRSELNEDGRAGALVALSLVERLESPEDLLSDLSAWALAHDSPTLVVAVPNVGHVDTGLSLLGGQFDPERSRVSDQADLHFYTEDSLRRLFDRTGWSIDARADVHALSIDPHARALRSGLPEEMVGALQATAEAVNPNWSVTHFVWSLTPVPRAPSPSSDAGASGSEAEEHGEELNPEALSAVSDYLASVGLVVSEVNRRAVATHLLGGGSTLPYSKRLVLSFVYGSPRRARLFKKVYGWLR
jgi:hypothetical protein